jgi:hypothetical protein
LRDQDSECCIPARKAWIGVGDNIESFESLLFHVSLI